MSDLISGENVRLGVIGVGNIGSMILDVLLNTPENSRYLFFIYNRSPEKMNKYSKLENVRICRSAMEVYKEAEFTFVCVKPHQTESVYSEIRHLPEESRVLVSTAAGKTLADIVDGAKRTRVIRIMPTITSRIGVGMTAVAYSEVIDEKTKAMFEKIFRPFGELIELPEEKFDAFTVLASSGPAFVAFVLESFIEGAINIGVNPDYARDIVLRTFEGSVKFLERMSIEPSRLKYMVSSPGGVTIRGLFELEKNAVKGAIMSAIQEAYNKSRSLGG
ncbi:pyrroline-5-carboxylate reductase [Fervidobacterium thailandense]|uniref:Pyrroline-5-carboxylate reductase n=1 Tax=Fervidobacterium thailandense TaxID=1008305 RepID=A0A1E3G348_9BACT|nr:pyrroline-5-carboxylate reductase [Fervidobacterium thailandense]ODN30639.1 hypothetical protein A4H02_03615 [Fervidobacterium thailandense]